MQPTRPLAALFGLFLLPLTASAHELGFSGLLGDVETLEPITLSSGKSLAEKPYALKSGQW